MSWTWRLESSDGTTVAGVTSPPHQNQSDAESWLGEQWRELAEAGVAQVTLLDAGSVIYGPMPLSEDSPLPPDRGDRRWLRAPPGPPVPPAQQRHQRRQHDRPYDHCVDEHRRRQPDAELLHLDHVQRGENREHRHHHDAALVTVPAEPESLPHRRPVEAPPRRPPGYG